MRKLVLPGETPTDTMCRIARSTLEEVTQGERNTNVLDLDTQTRWILAVSDVGE